MINFTIAVDAMGGDHGIVSTIPAVLRFLKHRQNASVILVGLVDEIQQALIAHKATLNPRLSIIAASEVVAMDEAPQLALKNKKHSSMRMAIDLVKSGQAQACVSAGNTGALMATARFVLKTFPGVDRPAIAKLLPNQQGRYTCVLDLGANVECTSHQLYQFAVMGAMLVAALQNKPRPSVGLLNIGAEDTKGSEMLRHTADLLRQSQLNFYGNVEGDDIFKGTVDVVVCDGFVGNVALKSSEGLVRMLSKLVRESFMAGFWSKFALFIVYPVLKKIKDKIDPSRYNGASFLGLRHIVVKSHGSADASSFFWALEQAANEVESGMIEHMHDEMLKMSSVDPIKTVDIASNG